MKTEAQKLRRRQMSELRHQLNRELWRKHRLTLGCLALSEVGGREAVEKILNELLDRNHDHPKVT